MLITCRCLNVAITTKNCDIARVDTAELVLTATERSDRFFVEAASQGVITTEVALVSKEQPSLVQVRNVGDWVIHCCLNCNTNTHAIHQEQDAALVLVSKAMVMNTSEIESLKNSEHYSKVFRIIIRDSGNESPTPTRFAVSQLPAAPQAALSALQQHLTEMVQLEAARTEERVHHFTEMQYAALKEFRERAHWEHWVLARVLREAHGLQQPSPEDLDTPPSTPDTRLPPTTPTVLHSSVVCGPGSSGNVVAPHHLGKHLPLVTDVRFPSPHSPTLVSGNSAKLERRTVPVRLITQMSTPACRSDSLDTEGLFDLEGMEDNHTETFHSEDDSDSDDSGSHDEGIHIPRGRTGSHGQMAKSLPVNVPTFLAKNKQEAEDADDDRLPQDPMDIAASIKALAKSVHGEANVFGDLPRPRFSTQI